VTFGLKESTTTTAALPVIVLPCVADVVYRPAWQMLVYC